MVVSIVICFLFFYLFKMSLNIISLSGLILALGMMIDSSIIVTENISQYREKGYSLKRACITGTSEVVTPMLSPMMKGDLTSPRKSTATIQINRKPNERFCCKLEIV